MRGKYRTLRLYSRQTCSPLAIRMNLKELLYVWCSKVLNVITVTSMFLWISMLLKFIEIGRCSRGHWCAVLQEVNQAVLSGWKRPNLRYKDENKCNQNGTHFYNKLLPLTADIELNQIYCCGAERISLSNETFWLIIWDKIISWRTSERLETV